MTRGGRLREREREEAGRTVSLKPNGCNGAWDEFRSGIERTKRKEEDRATICSQSPFTARSRVSFFSPPRAFLYSSFPPRFVAPIINISQSPRLTARSAHRCCRCFFFFFFFLILFFFVLFFFLARHPRPAHPACIVADYK